MSYLLLGVLCIRALGLCEGTAGMVNQQAAYTVLIVAVHGVIEYGNAMTMYNWVVVVDTKAAVPNGM